MRHRNKLMIYTISVITMFMILPAFIFDDFESVMIWTWPFIFLGVGFVFLSVWIYENVSRKP